jgi:hypothetical protein
VQLTGRGMPRLLELGVRFLPAAAAHDVQAQRDTGQNQERKTAFS